MRRTMFHLCDITSTVMPKRSALSNHWTARHCHLPPPPWQKKVSTSTDFLASIPVQFEDAFEIAKRLFPEAVKDGRLPLGGSRPTLPMTLDIQETVDVFG